MEFGLFVQAHVPRHEVEADPDGAEHARLLREVELAEACDRAGFKYVWSVEHHFLEEYSHLSASEIVLPYIAARTKRVHVGSAIWNLTPPVNHPARVAERVAMLDHLSGGRFEFGTGRGSSSTEFKGLRIPHGGTSPAERTAGYVTATVACVPALLCMDDRREAREIACRMGSSYHTSLVFRYLDTFPRPAGIPEWPKVLPEHARAARRTHPIGQPG